jgi:hypothetical protein
VEGDKTQIDAEKKFHRGRRRNRPPAYAAGGTPTSPRTGYAPVNGLNLFFELLGGGKKDAGWDGSGMSNARLGILPGLTHYNIFSSPVLASTITPFLDARQTEHTR